MLILSGISAIGPSSNEHLPTPEVQKQRIDETDPLAEAALASFLGEGFPAQPLDQDISVRPKEHPVVGAEEDDPVVPPVSEEEEKVTSIVQVKEPVGDRVSHADLDESTQRATDTTRSNISSVLMKRQRRLVILIRSNWKRPMVLLGAALTLTLISALLVWSLASGSVGHPGVGSMQIDAGGFGAGSFVTDGDFTNITPGRPSGISSVSSSVTIDTSGVRDPAPESVYQTARVGDCLYTIAHLTAHASYRVRLHFAETYWKQRGKRIFNVAVNDQVVLSNFDIFATAGAENKAIVKEFVVPATSHGTITIQFASIQDNAQINGIEVLAI